MTIVLIVEGATEKAFLAALRAFVQNRVENRMPRLKAHVEDGRIPTGDKLRRVVERYLSEGADAVIALTDVYTGTGEFAGAADAKQKMRLWVGAEPRFHPHAAQHDFEAWLIPYWGEIQRLSGSNCGPPGARPENINHNRPPAHRIAEIFRAGSKGRYYSKVRDARRILEGQDLAVAARQCPELAAFLNTVLGLCGAQAAF